MNNKADRRKFIIIVVAVTAFVVMLGIVATMISNHAQKNANNKVKDITTGQGDYYDPNSHQTISNPAGKTPESYGSLPDTPAFLGLPGLLDNGITSAQVGDFKFGVYQFLKSTNIKASEVSIAVDTIVAPHNPNSDVQTMTFNIVLDRKTTYKIQFDYSDLVTADVHVFDNTGKPLYDSGSVSNQDIS